MKHRFLFRMMAMLTIWLYLASMALAGAGQVVTQAERGWAKQAMDMAGQEQGLSKISSSNTLAVINYHNKTGQVNLDALQKGMAVMLISDLAKVDKIQVIERIKVQALLDEMGLGASGIVDPATAPQLGKMLGAYYIAGGDILAGKFTKIQLNSSVLDVPFKILSEQAPTVGEINELFRMEKEILFNIIKQMNVFLTPAEKVELEKPLSASTAALFALFLGINYSDQGQYNKAAQLYQEALVEDPNLSMAGDALQELKSLGLIPPEGPVPAGDVAEVAAAGEGGSGIGTLLAVGGGLALIGGGVAFAMSGSSDSDSDGSSPPAANSPTLASTNPEAESSISCSSGSISFQFSEVMDTTSGSVLTSFNQTAQIPTTTIPTVQTDWTGSDYWLSDSKTFLYSWDSKNTNCLTGASSLTTSLSNFKSAGGVALSGTSSVKFEVLTLLFYSR